MTMLTHPAKYFPIARGRYDVSPGLFQFGADFGNGEQDRRVFQIDVEFERYRQNKIEARQEDLAKYYRVERYAVAEGSAIAQFITTRLAKEYPQWISVERGDGSTTLSSVLTKENLVFDAKFNLIDVSCDGGAVAPAYVSALDALACQVPEDLAVVSAGTDGSHWVSAIHACAPNHWSPAAKVGGDFASIHQPVAGMESTNRAQLQMVDAMIFKGPYVRFTWGLATDQYLNHHPVPAPGHDPALWAGRSFDPSSPSLYLRVERQVSWGFPEIGAALFTIRTYFEDCTTLREDRNKRDQLVSAIESMSKEQLAYKGLSGQRDAILQRLCSPN
jgi:hypothetical protein